MYSVGNAVNERRQLDIALGPPDWTSLATCCFQGLARRLRSLAAAGLVELLAAINGHWRLEGGFLWVKLVVDERCMARPRSLVCIWSKEMRSGERRQRRQKDTREGGNPAR